MSPQNLYFIQPGYSFDSGGVKRGIYLPYAAGALAAYSLSRVEISGKYALRGIIYAFDDIDAAVASFEQPFLAGFSNYVWNFEYNKRFARKLKAAFPDCVIVFGGHQVAPGAALLDECAEIDFLVHGEGEEPFASLLTALAGGGSFDRIPNISFRIPGAAAVTTPAAPCPGSDYPSPYTEDIFDSLLENDAFEFYAIIETNRGCPHRCAFCDWCATGTRLKVFPQQRVLEDIRWIAAHQIEYCFAADANFCILERDEIIADQIIASKHITGFPQRFDVTYAKGREDAVFNTARKLFEAGMFKGPSLSFQSLCPEALENVGRSNMTLESFAGLLGRYTQAGIPAYSEMILGLPGESYESFCSGIGKLLEYGQHNYIDIFRCELLVNSPMAAPDYIRRHGIKTVRTPSIQHHIKPRQREVHGYSDIVVATGTMNTDMWERANLFAIAVQCFHHMGLLKYAAIYLFQAENIRYELFYQTLLAWLETTASPVCGGVFRTMRALIRDFINSGTELSYVNPVFGDLTWFPEEGAFLEYALALDAFYREIRAFFASFPMEPGLLEDLLAFQKSVIRRPAQTETEVLLCHDWYDYFTQPRAAGEPVRRANRLRLRDDENPGTWPDYARRCVWFGRRAGKTQLLDGCGSISAEYIDL